jgi:hypothetical protein
MAAVVSSRIGFPNRTKLRRPAEDISSYLKGDDSAHAVSNENGLLDLEFSTEPCEVIGELHHRVFLQRRIAGAVSKEIRGYDAVVPSEVIDLW